MSELDEQPVVPDLTNTETPAKPVFFSRFQTRLLMWLIGLSATTSVVAGYVYYQQQLQFVRDEQSKRGSTLISNLAGQSELGAYARDSTFLRSTTQRTFVEDDVDFVAIYSRDGTEILHLAAPGVSRPAPRAEFLKTLLSDTSARPRQTPRASYIDFFAPIISAEADAEESLFGSSSNAKTVVLGVAHLSLSREPAIKKLDEVLNAGIRLTLIIMALGVLVALFIARRTSQPILALAIGADKLRRGDLGIQLRVKRKDELGLLADSFNLMSADLARNVASLEHFNRHLEEEVNRRTEALTRSRDFVALLNAPLQWQSLLDSALAELVASSQAKGGAIFIHEQDWLLAASYGPLQNYFETSQLVARQIVLSAQRPVADPQLIEPPPPIPGAAPDDSPRALIFAPLRFRESTEGVLVLAIEGPASPDQIDFLTSASSQLATAVANAKAYRNTARLARKLEQRNVDLAEQRDQLEQVNRLKNQFLANISHEIRTPLNAVVGYTELLADGIYGPVNEEQLDSLSGISENAANLLQLINEILDLSKVEAGKMSMDVREVDLCQTVRDVVDTTAPLARKRPYEVCAELPAAPRVIRTDPIKVRQILVNLVGNAIKFTEKGSVRVRLVPTNDGGATITVDDTGIGISKENLSNIFDEFRQVDGSSTRAYGGTGLGLAISRKLATMVGGEISVRSALGRGSSFTLRLPLECPAGVDNDDEHTSVEYASPLVWKQ